MKLVKKYKTGNPVSIRVNWKISVNQLVELSKLGWKIQKEAI